MDGKDGRSSHRDGRSFRWTGRGWKSLPKCRQWLRGPLVGPGIVRKPSQRVGNGREAHPNDWGVWKPSKKGQEPGVLHGGREGSRCPSEGPGGVRRHFQRARRDWEGLERSGGLLGGSVGVGRSIWRAGKGQ